MEVIKYPSIQAVEINLSESEAGTLLHVLSCYISDYDAFDPAIEDARKLYNLLFTGE